MPVEYPITSDLEILNLTQGSIDYSLIVSARQIESNNDSKINTALSFSGGGAANSSLRVISYGDRKKPNNQGGIGLEISPGLTAQYGPWSNNLIDCISMGIDAFSLCKANELKEWEREEKSTTDDYNREIETCKNNWFVCRGDQTQCDSVYQTCVKNATEKRDRRRRDNDQRLQDGVGEKVVPNTTWQSPDGKRRLSNPTEGGRRLSPGHPNLLPGLYYPYDGLTPTPTIPDPTNPFREIPRSKCRCCKIADDVEKNCIEGEGTVTPPGKKPYPYGG